MIRVMRDWRCSGKVGSATTFLTALCGSVVIRHIRRLGEALRECGTEILLGFNRFWSTMCCLVVSVSQTGTSPSPLTSSSDSEASVARRFFFDEASCNRLVSVCMCCRRAREAFKVCNQVRTPLRAQRSHIPGQDLADMACLSDVFSTPLWSS